MLPQRNLLRQLTWGLPSGQAIARAMGVEQLDRGDLAEIGSVYAPFARSTPLWYYVLAEAKATAGGMSLGPVGGRIVAETLIGLLRADPSSYLGDFLSTRAFGHFSGLTSRSERPLTQHHRQPQLHARALPLLRRGRHSRNLSLNATNTRHRECCNLSVMLAGRCASSARSGLSLTSPLGGRLAEAAARSWVLRQRRRATASTGLEKTWSRDQRLS